MERIIAGAVNEVRQRQNEAGERTENHTPGDPARTVPLAAGIRENQGEQNLRDLIATDDDA